MAVSHRRLGLIYALVLAVPHTVGGVALQSGVDMVSKTAPEYDAYVVEEVGHSAGGWGSFIVTSRMGPRNPESTPAHGSQLAWNVSKWWRSANDRLVSYEWLCVAGRAR